MTRKSFPLVRNLPARVCPGAKLEVTILVVKWKPGDVHLGKEQIIFNLKKQVMSTLKKEQIIVNRKKTGHVHLGKEKIELYSP